MLYRTTYLELQPKSKNKLKPLDMLQRTRSRKDKHTALLFDTIKSLNDAIMEDIIQGAIKQQDFDVPSIKHRAKLMVKYSRRLKLLKY